MKTNRTDIICALLIAAALFGAVWWTWSEFREPGREADITLGGFENILYEGVTLKQIDAGPIERVFKNGAHVSAYRSATNFISELLVAPASARFAKFEESNVTGKHLIGLEGHVDSQNGFGALVRSRFKVVLRKNAIADEWVIFGMRMWDSHGEPVKPDTKFNRETFAYNDWAHVRAVDRPPSTNPPIRSFSQEEMKEILLRRDKEIQQAQARR